MKKICLISSLLLLVGKGYSLPAPVPLFQELPATSVVVRINGRDFTKAYILRRAKAHMMLIMNKTRKTKIGRRECKLFAKDCQLSISRMLNAAAVAAYSDENSVSVPSNVLLSCARMFSRNYGIRSKKLKRWHTVDDLKYMLGDNAWYADQAILEQARYVVVTNAILSSKVFTVTDEMVTNRIASIVHDNEIAAKTNALIYARATNVWSQIVRGTMKFEVAATNYSEDAYLKDGCEWGTFTLDQIVDDAKLFELLPTLNVGAITPPVESDNGLAIIRVDDRSADRKTYTFSRIFFRLPMFYEMESSDVARAILLADQKRNFIRTTLEAQRDRLKVEYPSGKELFAEGSAPFVLTKGDLNP